MYNEYRRIFVVPCTSQAAKRDVSGNLFPELMEGTVTDGFEKTTTVMLTEARFIDKARVISEVGIVKNPFYNDLYNRLFERLFESRSFSIKKLKELNDLKDNELIKIKNEYSALNNELNIIKEKKEKLTREYNIIKELLNAQNRPLDEAANE
jgi:hypothetical protein